MRCKTVKKLFFNYIEDSLTNPEKTEFENHLNMCDECRRELEIVKSFYESIEVENVKAPDEMVLRLRDKIEKTETTVFDKITAKILYPATVIFGLTLGIIIANLLYTPSTYDETITLLSNNTIIVEPIIDLDGEMNE